MTHRRIENRALFAICAIAASACGQGRLQTNADLWHTAAPLAAPGTLHIRNADGPINVKPSADGQFRVTADARWHRGNPGKDVRFQQVAEGADITVCASRGSATCSWSRFKTRSSGLQAFFGVGTDAEVTLNVEVPQGVKVDVLTMNGALSVLATAPVSAITTNGTIRVGTSVGPVTALTTNGDVDVRMTTLATDGNMRVASVNGTVVAYVPEITDADVQMGVVNGRLGSDFADLAESGGRIGKAAHHVFGAGARKFSFNSVNGSVYVRLINADGTIANARNATAPASPSPSPGKNPAK